MKLSFSFSSIIGLALITASCSGSGKNGSDNSEAQNSTSTAVVTKAFAESPVVGERKLIGTDSVAVIILNKKPEKVVLKASDIMDDLRIVRLENSDDAVVGSGKVWTGGDRLFIYDGQVVKQFDMSGKYIGNVGARGQGPGEYSIAPYNIYVDEESGRICLLQYNADAIMTYDMNGQFVENIPLVQKVNKGFMKVDLKNNRVTIAALIFKGDDNRVVWTQDLKGNLISSTPRESVVVVPDFSNEVEGCMSPTDDSFYYSLFNIEAKADTLYKYADGSLRPEFTVDFGGEVPVHEYLNFPKFYIVLTFSEPQYVSEGSYIIPANTPFLVDKETLRGAPAQLMLDNIGPVILDNDWQWQTSADYFLMNINPASLLSMIENAPEEHPLVTEKDIKRMEELRKTIDEEDNNYIVIGKWKK